jgi:putative transposase
VAGVSHLRRPSHLARHPLHITLRVQRGVASLRQGNVFARVRSALASGKARFGFSLVHFSVQSNHLHLIAEAHDQRALARGVQGLAIRIARAVNRALQRKGRLFADRYHARALKTPRAVRFALRYVLLNTGKHAAEQHAKAAKAGHAKAGGGDSVMPAGFVDSCSSAPWFHGFSRPDALIFGARQARAEWLRASGSLEPPVVPARCWLLRMAHRLAGEFDVDEVPARTRQKGVSTHGAR